LINNSCYFAIAFPVERKVEYETNSELTKREQKVASAVPSSAMAGPAAMAVTTATQAAPAPVAAIQAQPAVRAILPPPPPPGFPQKQQPKGRATPPGGI